MKTHTEPAITSNPKTINQLVKLIISNALPSVLRTNSFILNDVPADLNIIADKNMLATVLSRLLYCVVNNAESSCIRISAKEYDDIIFIHFKSSCGINNDSDNNDLQQAQAYAKKMNGNIGLDRELDKITGIVFSFPNMDFSKNDTLLKTEINDSLF